MHFPKRIAFEDTKARGGDRHHAVGRRLAHLLLHADEIAGQQKAQDLAAAIAERFVTKGPARQQGVERRIGLAFMNQGGVSSQAALVLLERLHQCQFFIVVRQKQRQRAQRAVGAIDVRHEHSFVVVWGMGICLLT